MEIILAVGLFSGLAGLVWAKRKYAKLLAAQTPEVRARWSYLSTFAQA